jgi:hypothetical protein
MKKSEKLMKQTLKELKKKTKVNKTKKVKPKK